MSNVIIFDLDGVITSEEAYWITAGLVLHELLYSPCYWNITGARIYEPPTTFEACQRLSHAVLPEAVILGFKAHAINSNWDTCYAAFCISLLDLLATLPDPSALLPLRPADADWIAAFRQAQAQERAQHAIAMQPYQRLALPIFQEYVGLELLQRFNDYASAVLNQPVEPIFARYSASWKLCRDIFQEWYLGDELYEQAYGHAPAQSGKCGCIRFEQPLLPVEQLRTMLETLRAQGYILGVATGRPGQEAILPLKNYGLYDYFDASHIITDTEVSLAEKQLRASGDTTSLFKPHPYPFIAAAYPGYQPGQPLPSRDNFIVVGDTSSDVRGGRAAGAITVAVLTGARTEQARRLLEQTEPDFIVADVTHVPVLLEQIDDLETIQRLQFTEREKAERLLQRWFARHMSLQVESVTLMPKAVSLNSFNGVYRVAGEEYFFKTHVEDQGVLEEYYHAEMLYNAGYNVVRPLRTLHEKGQQMVIYPVVHWPVMFDLLRAVETGDTTQATAELLVAAEKRECERLLRIYRETQAQSSVEEHAQAPIHQLFWHRLTGGRLKKFYAGQRIPLPEQRDTQHVVTDLLFEELLTYDWTINGHAITGDRQTLGALLEQAKVVLHPARAAATVIGHGDAHFGNVFLEDQQYYRYFDPAFAGRHMPLLDIVKPFFHNIYATWMYFPREVAQNLQLSVAVRGTHIFVEHNYELTPVRQALLDTKREYLLQPLIALLRDQHALPDDWDEIMRMALLCCPLLTVNLLDATKRSAAICWLGLSQVMQIGSLPL